MARSSWAAPGRRGSISRGTPWCERSAWLVPVGGGRHSGDPSRIPCRDCQPDTGMGTWLDVEDIKWTGACVGVPVNELQEKMPVQQGGRRGMEHRWPSQLPSHSLRACAPQSH